MKLKTLIFLIIIFLLLFIREIGRQAYLHNIRWLYLIVLSFSITYFLVPFVIEIAKKYNLLDYPNKRKVHKEPTPRIGGLAVFLGIFISLLRNLQFAKEVLGFLIALCLIFFISLLDDIYSLSAVLRLLSQIIASLVLVFFGFKITALTVGFPLEHFLETIITIIWIVGITNAINFLDGIDGLVAGFGVFCSFTFLFLSLLTGQKYVSYLSAVLLGASLGFLPYNWHKAKIFLGDSGSTVIGFMLASISIIGWWAEKNPIVSLSTPVLILGVPIYDMIYITISRIKNKQVKNFKEWIEYVGKDHIHHRLLNLGFSVPASVGMILLISFCLSLYTILMKFTVFNDKLAVVTLSQAGLIFVILSIFMVAGRRRTN
jgi:UDP-GlcNAc:undecaprenyl-phosphate GlcNAc-1-phosphate transferase